MNKDSSNLFRFLDRKWTRIVLPSVLLVLLGFLLVISILDPLIPSVHRIAQQNNLYIIGVVAVLVTGMPLLFYWLSKLTVHDATEGIALGSVDQESIAQLIHQMRPPYGDLDICAYTGPTIIDALSAAEIPEKAFNNVRILLRHPGVSYMIPSDSERSEAMRQRIKTDVDHLQLIFGKAAVRFEIRGYADEPSIRSITVGGKTGAFHLYTTGIRLTGRRVTPDFVSRGKPTFLFNTRTPIENSLMATIIERFNDIWRVACPMVPQPVVLFDFDGTLFNSLEAHKEAWKRTLTANGFGGVTSELGKLIESGLTAPDVLDHLQLPFKSRDSLVNKKRECYREILASGSYKLFDEVRETITFLRRKGYILGVVTTASKEIVESTLEKAGIKELFSALVCIEDTSRPKPDPEVLKKACLALNVETTRAILVGDSISDQQAALSAGMPFILLIRAHTLTGYGRYPRVRPFHSIFSLADLKEFLL
jgi:HAD superfamily hydrolase (TIGR01509 family)